MANMTPKARRNKKERLIAMYGSYCCYCGKYLRRREMTLEHLIAKRDGGSNAIENLRIACYYCNHSRHNNI
jgi:5-methylcytosine-specific restriction endonuclease McrA